MAEKNPTRTALIATGLVVLIAAMGVPCFYFLYGLAEQKAEVESPLQYDKDGLRFAYPGNWTVTEDQNSDNIRYLFVESPGDAIFVIQVYQEEEAVEIDEYVEWFGAQVKEEIPVGAIGGSDTTAVRKVVAGEQRDGVKERFSIEIIGTFVPHLREYFRIHLGAHVVFLVGQAATEDWGKVAPGFDLVLQSFELR